MPAENNEQQKWKARYYDALDDLEKREKQWDEIEQALRQGLNRLSLAADDTDAKLNRQLEKLRQDIRNSVSHEVLQQHLTQISDSILRLDEARKGGAVATAADDLQLAKELLGKLIDGIIAEEQQRQLSSRLAAAEQETALQQLADELIMLLNDNREEALAEKEELPVSEVLVRLIERLDIPAELGRELEAVKAMLQQNPPASEMDKVIVAIADLITEMRSRMQSQKAEIEGFLKQLTARLQEIDNTFQQAMSNQRESFRDGKALDSAVSEQVIGIADSVKQAAELGTLKQLVQQRLDTINQHLTQFRSAEQRRIEEAEQRVTELNQKLEAVQNESASLRKRLKAERNQAMIDPLTGIPNRLAYNDRIRQEYARWQRYGTPLTIAVWDVDKFKSINDTYGHQAGDKVLSVIAKVLHRQSRETDFVARFGGEEFVLLLPETDIDNAHVASEKLRKAVEEAEFHFRGKRVPITISCGLSQFQANDTPEQVFERADKALYQAKHSGRNRCSKG